MYLNIILTILVVVLITITVLLSRWWRKFGKDMFSLTSKFRNSSNESFKMNMSSNFPNMQELKQNLKNINELFGKMKK